MSAIIICSMANTLGLYAVIVNWNLKKDTLRCADSLFEAGLLPGQLLIVDNASNDGSVEAFEDRFGDRVRISESAQNLGFTGGVNIGIRQALDLGAEWILMVNNDTVINRDMLDTLLGVAAVNKDFTLFGPSIFFHDKPDRIWFFGHRLVPGTLFTRPVGLSANKLEEVDFLSGCGMMIHRKVFEAVGLLDTSLFMYGEEVDFCWRARAKGFRLGAVGDARMWHKVSASSNWDKPRTRHLRVRNQVWFYRRYMTAMQKPVMFLGSTLRAIFMSLSDLVRGQRSTAMAHWRGFFDGWWGKVPKYAANTYI